MNKESISNKQGIGILSLFLLGSSLILGTGKEAKQDVWIAIILAILMSLPMLLIYSKLLTMFPGKNLYDILQDTLGKILGNVTCILFIWHTFLLGAMLIRVLVEFVNVISFPDTPQFITTIFFGLLCIWIIRAGIEVLGRFSLFILPIVVVVLMIIYILSIGNMEFINIKPVLYNGMKPVMSGTFTIFSLPLTQTVVFTMVFHSLKNINKTFKVIFISVLLGLGVLLISNLKNILVLGTGTYDNLYFPSYTADRIIKIGDFLERIEVVAAVTFQLCVFVKTSVCLYTTSIGVAKILKIEDYKKIVAPIGLLMMNLSRILYNNVMEMFYWTDKIYKYYAVPFQVILPIITLIAAELKIRAAKDKKLIQ